MTVIANPPIWQQNRQYSARLDRTVVDLIFTEGVVDPGSGDFEVIETSPQSLSVAVGIGRAVIQGDDETRQGKYLIVNDAVVNVAITAAPSAPNDRIDLIVLQVNDPVAGSVRTPANVAEVVAIAGTPSVTPSAPALPATAIPLAEVYVAAGATFIATADITDVRTPAVVGDLLEDVWDYGTVTTNTVIDLALAPVQTIEVAAAVTLTITNAPVSASKARSTLLLVQQDVVGSRAVTWSGVDRWFNEIDPTGWPANEERAVTFVATSAETRAFVVAETV